MQGAGSAFPAAEAAEDGTPALDASHPVPDTVADSGSDGKGNGDGGTKAADGVDIPKQQTVDEASDDGAGEGARAQSAQSRSPLTGGPREGDP
ncbi:hypothetical protein EW053_31735 [Streptomyces sp. IB2014 016-6]|nr:hypothetical protein EW053_31735 [Streptomyces sp. IB2014 016-6]